ncbi:MAG TPA: tripartite tricarboxylate transporter substrate-binding protein [Burkholderiales bacterium]|nr:tripartite tricarboxylate transporter substrate-binding protein [Burkholderiales bacterium]
MKRRQVLLGAAGAALAPLCARAQTTSKTLRIVVPFPPGGGTDVLARIIAEKLRGAYAPIVLVENKVGASGRTGVEAVKNAEPDGSTLLFTPDFLLTVYPHSFRHLAYDPLKDFTPIAMVARSALGFAAGPALPEEAKSVQDYVAWAKANPKKAFFADTSPGGTPHFVGVMLAQASGVQLTAVHYKGGAPALQDLVGGQVPVSINPLSELLPQLKSGKIRVLAVTSPQRSKFLPGVPTMSEAGFPSIAFSSWLGIFAPAHLEPETVKRLANGIADATAHGEAQQSILKFAMEPAAMTPVGFAAQLKADLERWAPIVKASGFTADG